MIIPVYNEHSTLQEVIARVLAVPLAIELICVDDGSRDVLSRLSPTGCSPLLSAQL